MVARELRPAPRWQPLVAQTTGSATEGIYGLVMATSVLVAAGEHDAPADAGRTAVKLVVAAGAFWLAHVYASLLGMSVSHGRVPTRPEVARALREHWSLVEVASPLVLVLALGALAVIPDLTALVAATILALTELAAVGGYAGLRQGAGPLGVLLSATIAAALGAFVVLLKVLF